MKAAAEGRKRSAARTALRADAEARLALRLPLAEATVADDAIRHELHVHQIELEMQNEQLRLTQQALEESRDRYVDLYEFAPVGYLILTASGQIVEVNRAGARLLGTERKKLLARRFDHYVAADDRERWQRLFAGLDKADELHVDTVRLRRLDGTQFSAQIDCRRRDSDDGDNPAVRLVLIDLHAIRSDDEINRLAAIAHNPPHVERGSDSERMRQLAFFDPLTGLPNRRLMMDRLLHAMATIPRTHKFCSLLFIDLDNFKGINDTLGHDIGDLLLKQAAQRLSACVREGDTVARHGGDEFVVILENLSESRDESANQAKGIGEKIVHALELPYALVGHEYVCSASIGATLFNNPDDSAAELLKRADIAMYEAKTAGRNALRFFDPAMQALVDARATLEGELRRALQEHQLECHFQAQADRRGRIPGAEVLLRWQHPQRGLMTPADFIRVAEESGVLSAIGQWVLETACAQLKAWESARPQRHLRLAVNVGERQFRQKNFVADVGLALAQSGAAAADLTLEFKEKTVLADLDASLAKMDALKQLGVRLSIDDFGLGCSSLSHLTRLPLDQLKIDRALVHGIDSGPRNRAIVRSLIDVTRHLGMEVLAEGVETDTQRAFLDRHGCHAFQGYLFGKPLPGIEFEQQMLARPAPRRHH